MDALDDAAIAPVLRGLAVAIVLRVSVFAIQVHMYILMDMIYHSMQQPFNGPPTMRKCTRRMLSRLAAAD